MAVSVVVAAASIDEHLKQLIKSLERQTLLPDEVVVVVPKRSHDACGLVGGTSLEVKVVELARDPGPMRARVFGGLAARGRYVAFIDSDCLAPPDWLESIVAEAEKWRVDAVAGSVVGANSEKFLSRAQDRSIIAPNPRHRRKLLCGSLGLTLVVTANMLVRREVLFDERVIPPSYGRFGFEDLDFAHRMLATGRRILCSPVLVYHHNRTSLPALLKRYYEYGRGLPLFRRRSHGSFYSKVLTLLTHSLAAVLVAAAVLSALSHAAAAASLLALVLTPLYLYHLLHVRQGGLERLVYPLVDLALAVAATAGVFVSELELLLERWSPGRASNPGPPWG